MILERDNKDVSKALQHEHYLLSERAIIKGYLHTQQLSWSFLIVISIFVVILFPSISPLCARLTDIVLPLRYLCYSPVLE